MANTELKGQDETLFYARPPWLDALTWVKIMQEMKRGMIIGPQTFGDKHGLQVTLNGKSVQWIVYDEANLLFDK